MWFTTVKKYLASVLIVTLVIFAPMHVAQAKGGFDFVSIILAVASIAAACVGVPPIFLGESLALGGADTLIGGAAMLDAFSTAALTNAGFAAMVSIGGSTLTSAGSALLDSGGGGGGSSGVPPNARIYAFTNALSEVPVGGRAKLTGTVTNNGDASTAGSFQNRFEIFSERVVLDNSHDLAPSPILVTVSGSIAPGNSTEVDAYWTVPNTFTPGAYYLRFCADIGNSVSEVNYGNKCGDMQSFTVVAATQGATASAPIASVNEVAPTQDSISDLLPPAKTQLAAASPFHSGPDLMAGIPAIVPAPLGGYSIVACSAGYWFDVYTHTCIPDEYISCESTGYPNNLCLRDSQICNGSRCEAKAGGQHCKATVGTSCQGAENSCYMSYPGFKSCDGSCQVMTPPDTGCAKPLIDTSKSTTLANIGKTCTIRWSIKHATACQMTPGAGNTDTFDSVNPKPGCDPNYVDPETGASDSTCQAAWDTYNASYKHWQMPVPKRTIESPYVGSYVSMPLQSRETYTITCYNGTYVKVQQNVNCTLNPKIQEI